MILYSNLIVLYSKSKRFSDLLRQKWTEHIKYRTEQFGIHFTRLLKSCNRPPISFIIFQIQLRKRNRFSTFLKVAWSSPYLQKKNMRTFITRFIARGSIDIRFTCDGTDRHSHPNHYNHGRGTVPQVRQGVEAVHYVTETTQYDTISTKLRKQCLCSVSSQLEKKRRLDIVPNIAKPIQYST